MSSNTVRQKLLASVAASLLLSSAGYIDDASASRGRKKVETEADSDKSKGRGTAPNKRVSLLRQEVKNSPRKSVAQSSVKFQTTDQESLTPEQITQNLTAHGYAFTLSQWVGTINDALPEGAEWSFANEPVKISNVRSSPKFSVPELGEEAAKPENLTIALNASIKHYVDFIQAKDKNAFNAALKTLKDHYEDEDGEVLDIMETDTNPFNLLTVTVDEEDEEQEYSLFQNFGAHGVFLPHRAYYPFSEIGDTDLYHGLIEILEAKDKQEKSTALRAQQEEAARLEKEEADRQEQARLEKEERAAARKAQKEKEAQERAARLEQERLAQVEADRLEQERLAQVEAARLEQERLAQVEADRLEQERLAQEEADRQEQARLEKEERAAARKAQKEKEAQVEAARLEQERLAQVEADRLEQERLAQVEADRQEQARQAEEKRQNALRVEQERLEKERAKKQKEQERIAKQQRKEEERIAGAMNRIFADQYPNLEGMTFSLDEHKAIKALWNQISEFRGNRQSVQQDHFIETRALHPQHFYDVASEVIAIFKSNPKAKTVKLDRYTFGIEDNKLVVIGKQGQKVQASAFYKDLEMTHREEGLALIQQYNEQISEIKQGDNSSQFSRVLKLMKANTKEGKLLKAAITQKEQSIEDFIRNAVHAEATRK